MLRYMSDFRRTYVQTLQIVGNDIFKEGQNTKQIN